MVKESQGGNSLCCEAPKIPIRLCGKTKTNFKSPKRKKLQFFKFTLKVFHFHHRIID